MTNYILITGASSGIGRSISIELAKNGYQCILVGRSLERLKQTQTLLDGQSHIIFNGDINDDDFKNYLLENMPNIIGLIHAAGIIKLLPWKFINKIDFTKIMETNFYAPFFLTQSLLIKKKLNDRGSIVFISSISGPLIGSKGNLMYSSSKSAVNGMIKTLALELAPRRIRVNSISAGMILSEMWTNGENSISEEQLNRDILKYPLGYGKPSDLAKLTKFLVSDDSSWITGSTIVADGGFTIQ